MGQNILIDRVDCHVANCQDQINRNLAIIILMRSLFDTSASVDISRLLLEYFSCVLEISKLLTLLF
jgi:hypothetical protein